jgi:hypothetical protein
MRIAQYQPPETTQTTPRTVEDSVGVWDLVSGDLVGEVPLLGHTTDRFFNPDAQIALSPDGKLLSVLEDGVSLGAMTTAETTRHSLQARILPGCVDVLPRAVSCRLPIEL